MSPMIAWKHEHIFRKSVKKHKIARECERRSMTHCPIAIRLGAHLCGKVGHSGGLYNLVAASPRLPTRRRLQTYTIPSSNQPDGVLFANILRKANLFVQRNPGASQFDWERHSFLAFDSMPCKGSLWNYHTNKNFGMGVGSLHSDVIMKGLKELNNKEKSNKQLLEDFDNESEIQLPDPAKHFLVFILTAWSPTTQEERKSRHQVVCARYGLKFINSAFLLQICILNIIVHLFFYEFIVNTITDNDASENRSAFKSLANKLAKEILQDHYRAELLDTLNLNFNIAFIRPNPENVGDIIGANIPH